MFSFSPCLSLPSPSSAGALEITLHPHNSPKNAGFKKKYAKIRYFARLTKRAVSACVEGEKFFKKVINIFQVMNGIY